jgi:hypothetical protein
MALLVISILVVVGLFVFAPVSWLRQRRTGGPLALARPNFRRTIAVGSGVVVVLVG